MVLPPCPCLLEFTVYYVIRGIGRGEEEMSAPANIGYFTMVKRAIKFILRLKYFDLQINVILLFCICQSV